MSAFQNLKLSIEKLGVAGTLRLVREKQGKKRRLMKLLGKSPGLAVLKVPIEPRIEISEAERIDILARADEMLRDENYIFAFRHHLKNVADPWNYDPLEEKYWPKRRYEETKIHSADTPRDGKIVWEVNRFKHLPLLAQAAYLTKDKKYVDEIEWRILSWIEGNPFAGSVNWSSPLEIAIRAISWTATLRILAMSGFELHKNEAIARCIWQYAAYLDAELSTDKIVRSNHLIGETAGLALLATYFDYEDNVFHLLRGRGILADEIPLQTFADGASRESSGWYHTFVTDFLELVVRSTAEVGYALTPDTGFTEQLAKLEIYRNSIVATDGEIVKYGDCDFGKAINLTPQWKDIVFGKNPFETTERKDYFETTQHITARFDKNYLFVRAGEFGLGGDGFSSHAHDDFLSPIVYLDGFPIIVDPGTYVYNGNPTERDKYRKADYHNGLIILTPNPQPAYPKPHFGWFKTRPNASIDSFDRNGDKIIASTSYGEWRGGHKRWFTLGEDECIIEDAFSNSPAPNPLLQKEGESIEWNFHFHPRWRLEKISPQKFSLHDYRNNYYTFELSKAEAELELLPYDFSPSYGAKAPAYKLCLRMKIEGEFAVSFILKRMSALQ